MPQTPTDAKLYLWSSKGVEEQWRLTDFVSHEFGLKGDGRLYVEAHIMPKVGRWLLTCTRVGDAPPVVDANMSEPEPGAKFVPRKQLGTLSHGGGQGYHFP